MYRTLLLGTAAIALAAAATPARAQVPVADTEIEGPISAIDVTNGTITVMGITITVPPGTPVRTPTKTGLSLADFATGKMPGRSEEGFIGGTAIITGESVGGTFVANDVFSDLFEHVVVGEATAPEVTTKGVERLTVNGMKVRRSTDPRMPGAPPINGFGLRIDPESVQEGTLVAAEGYYSKGQNTLLYHALEADSADLVDQVNTQVSILRADCRIRGGGRDEVEVRGGVTIPADATVQIRLQINPRNPNAWTTIGTATAVADNTVNPPQGLYRADFRTLNLPDGCPAQVRAVIPAGAPGTTRQAVATADMASR
jgi:hypothetical protein